MKRSDAGDSIVGASIVFVVGIVLGASHLVEGLLYFVAIVPLLAIVSAFFVVRSAIVAAFAIRARSWRRAIVAALLPLAATYVALRPSECLQEYLHLGDVMRFVVMRSSLDAEVAREPHPRLRIFTWRSALLIGKDLVYDETDTVGRREGSPNAAWSRRVSHTDLSCETGFDPLWDHYYIVTIVC